MFRRISSSGARRGPVPASSAARDAIDVVRPDGQRHLRQFRTVERPVDLDRRNVLHEEPSQRHALDIVVAGGRHGGIHPPRKRGERADHADVLLQHRHVVHQLGNLGGRQLVDGQPGKPQTGNVDFLDRSAAVPQLVERRLRDQLEAGGAKLLQQRAKRDALAARELLEIGERKAGDRHRVRRRDHFLDPRRCRAAVGRHARDPHFAGRRRHDDRRARLRRDLRDAHKRRDRAVPPAARFVGHHPDGHDVVAGREGCEFCCRRHAP